MEALSIQAVKADTRPAETQTQGELGNIFQALLRDSVMLQEMPTLLPRADSRLERDAPLRDLSDERVGGASGDPRDRLYDRDADYRAPDYTGRERETAANTEDQPRFRPSTASDQPSDSREAREVTPASDSDTPALDDVQGGEEQIAVVGDIRVGALEPTRQVAAPAVTTPIAGNGGQANTAAVLPGASGKAASVPQPAVSTASQAQNPASPQPSAPAGGNGFSAQVTVTPAQIVAPPNAGLGGGAATAAIAVAANPGLEVPATVNSKPGTGMAQGVPAASVPNSDAQSSSGAGRQTDILSMARLTQAEGQALATQSASTAAAAATTQKQDAGSAGAETRTGAALNNPLASAGLSDAPLQSSLTVSGQAQASSSTSQDETGQKNASQNIAGQGDGTKTASARNQLAQLAPQVQTNQAAGAAVQTGGANAPVQGLQIGETGAAGGSTGSTDAASSRAASVSTLTTGGFSPTMAQGPDTLGSLTRSGGTHPSVANQVAVEIQKAVNAGKDQIRVRLHPAELGQIDVTLKVRQDGTVKAIVTIDRPETFDLMQRDARGLERALQDAGLKTDSGSLTFNLRGGDQQAPNDGQRGQSLAAQSNPETDRRTEIPLPEDDTPAPFASGHALDFRV